MKRIYLKIDRNIDSLIVAAKNGLNQFCQQASIAFPAISKDINDNLALFSSDKSTEKSVKNNRNNEQNYRDDLEDRSISAIDISKSLENYQINLSPSSVNRNRKNLLSNIKYV